MEEPSTVSWLCILLVTPETPPPTLRTSLTTNSTFWVVSLWTPAPSASKIFQQNICLINPSRCLEKLNNFENLSNKDLQNIYNHEINYAAKSVDDE